MKVSVIVTTHPCLNDQRHYHGVAQFRVLDSTPPVVLHVLLAFLKGVESSGVSPDGIVGVNTSEAPNRDTARARATVVAQKIMRTLQLEGTVAQGPDGDGYMLFTVTIGLVRPNDLWFRTNPPGYHGLN